MKHFVKKVLQRLLGIHGYLLVFSLFIIIKLRWDRNEKDFLHFLKLVPDQGTILDIGANIGVMTWYFSKKKKKTRILSFEPVTFNYKVLKWIVALFRLKNVKIYRLALGDKDDTIKMIIPKVQDVTLHGLCHVDEVSGENDLNGYAVSAKMLRLDKFSDVMGHPTKVVAIKLDVENYEFNVLNGAGTVLSGHRPIVYTELWENENRIKCIQLMQGHGYKTYIYVNNQPLPYTEKETKGQNFLFVPSESTLNL
jgi:FkbM family methyltransferase